MLLTKTEYLTKQQTKALVIIDPQVEAPEQLALGIKTNAEALILDANRDSVAQITTALAAGNYRSLHLISHGSPGCLHLGNTDLNSQTLERYRQQIMEWGVAEILIYGCNVAIQPELLKQLHELTGASIAASSVKVGRDNWNLEWQLGEVTLESVFKEELRRKYWGTFINFTESRFTAGGYPRATVIGDFDDDGADDIAIVNTLGDKASVLLGDGSGSFAPRTTFAVGDLPRSLALGDFNEDNVEDFAVVNANDNNISVLLGDGSGSFSNQTTFSTQGTQLKEVAVGDFNDDGLDDLVAIDRESLVSVLFGNGSGGFSSTATFATPVASINSVAIGDFNNDNFEDLAVIGFLGVSVLLGDGSGDFSGFDTFAAGSSPYSVAVGDFNGDNEEDLVVRNYSNDHLSVLLGDGSGGFSGLSTFATGDGPYSVAVGDFNDDQKDDIVATNRRSNNVSVLLGNGSGSFSDQSTFATRNFPFSVAVGDLDVDGQDDDLAVANFYSGSISVLIECFLTGTRVLTQRGEVAVEELVVGDLVQTKEGELEPVKWIGYQTIEPGSIKNTLRGNPVLVKAGALGHSLPTRDLYLSPDHSLFVDGLLINAGALVNDVSIVQTEPTDTFVYHSVELDNHALLTVEGTYAESYMPHHEERLNYDNGAEYEELYPHGSNLMLWPMDYPRVSSRTQVPRFVKEKLMNIAQQLGHAIEEMIA